MLTGPTRLLRLEGLAILVVVLAWLAHIGIDRALGYGLKLPTSFYDTHLGRIGRGLRESTPHAHHGS